MDYKLLAVSFGLVLYLWEFYLHSRQYRSLRREKIPKRMQRQYSHAEKAFSFARFHIQTTLARQALVLSVTFAGLYANLLPRVWLAVSRATGWLLPPGPKPMLWAAVLAGMQIALETVLQVALYGWKRRVYGNSVRQSLASVLQDSVVSQCFSWLLALVLLRAVSELYQISGAWFFVYAWMLQFAFAVGVHVLHPWLIAPRFNKFRPLADKTLRQRLEQLCNRVGFPLHACLEMDGSTRSSHCSASLVGVGKYQRIVLYDTLLEQMSPDEVEAVVAHELGHWRLGHLRQKLLYPQPLQLVQMYLLQWLMQNPRFYESFGFFDGANVALVGLVLFQLVQPVLGTVQAVAMNAVGRRQEQQADDFGVSLGYGAALKQALIKLHAANHEDPSPDRLFALWQHNHPSLLDRVARIERALAVGGRAVRTL